MADNLNYNNGKYSFYSQLTPGWHKKGYIGNGTETIKEIIEYSGLNYEVQKVPAYINAPNVYSSNMRELRVLPGTFGTYRMDTGQVLGTVGERYEVIQNNEAFDFMDDVLIEGQYKIETAGSLGNGEQIFVTAKVPGHIKMPNGNDIVDKYILFTNSHDGSSSIRAMLTPIRVVCNNTLNAALTNSTNRISIKHTKNAQLKLNEGRKLMNLQNIYFNDMEDTLNAMSKILINDQQTKNIAVSLIVTPAEFALYKSNDYKLRSIEEISTRKKNMVEDMIRTINFGIGQDMYQNTGLWIYNGVTCYHNNVVKYDTDDAKFKSIIDGTGNKASQEIFNRILNTIN